MSHLLLGHENVIKIGPSLLLKVILLTFRQINGGFDIAKPTQKGQKSSANQLYGSYVSQNFVRERFGKRRRRCAMCDGSAGAVGCVLSTAVANTFQHSLHLIRNIHSSEGEGAVSLT